MPNVLLSAFTGEGNTDQRFLGPLIRRTLEDLVWASPQQIDIYEPDWLGNANSMEVVAACQKAADYGHRLLVVHADADSASSQQARQERIQPALDELARLDIEEPVVVPLIPIQEVEAWMLADSAALIKELGTNLRPQDLNIHGDPERYADPKRKLEKAIGLANAGKGPHLQSEIGELYELLGNSIDLETLARLSSYDAFRNELRDALGAIGFL